METSQRPQTLKNQLVILRKITEAKRTMISAKYDRIQGLLMEISSLESSVSKHRRRRRTLRCLVQKKRKFLQGDALSALVDDVRELSDCSSLFRSVAAAFPWKEVDIDLSSSSQSTWRMHVA